MCHRLFQAQTLGRHQGRARPAAEVRHDAPGDGGRYKVDEVELAADEFKVDKDGPSLTLVASIVKVVPGG